RDVGNADVFSKRMRDPFSNRSKSAAWLKAHAEVLCDDVVVCCAADKQQPRSRHDTLMISGNFFDAVREVCRWSNDDIRLAQPLNCDHFATRYFFHLPASEPHGVGEGFSLVVLLRIESATLWKPPQTSAFTGVDQNARCFTGLTLRRDIDSHKKDHKTDGGDPEHEGIHAVRYITIRE